MCSSLSRPGQAWGSAATTTSHPGFFPLPSTPWNVSRCCHHLAGTVCRLTGRFTTVSTDDSSARLFAPPSDQQCGRVPWRHCGTDCRMERGERIRHAPKCHVAHVNAVLVADPPCDSRRLATDRQANYGQMSLQQCQVETLFGQGENVAFGVSRSGRLSSFCRTCLSGIQLSCRRYVKLHQCRLGQHKNHIILNSHSLMDPFRALFFSGCSTGK